MIYTNVLEAIGYTPMVRLNRMSRPDSAEVLVKFEGLNVGGSIKTRTAYNMILAAEKMGLVHKDTVIVEPWEPYGDIERLLSCPILSAKNAGFWSNIMALR